MLRKARELKIQLFFAFLPKIGFCCVDQKPIRYEKKGAECGGKNLLCVDHVRGSVPLSFKQRDLMNNI